MAGLSTSTAKVGNGVCRRGSAPHRQDWRAQRRGTEAAPQLTCAAPAPTAPRQLVVASTHAGHPHHWSRASTGLEARRRRTGWTRHGHPTAEATHGAELPRRGRSTRRPPTHAAGQPTGLAAWAAGGQPPSPTLSARLVPAREEGRHPPGSAAAACATTLPSWLSDANTPPSPQPGPPPPVPPHATPYTLSSWTG